MELKRGIGLLMFIASVCVSLNNDMALYVQVIVCSACGVRLRYVV